VHTQSDRAAETADPFRDVRYWWVNHKRTHSQELEGEFLWSAKKKNGGGGDRESHSNMTRIMPGDVVFSYSVTAGMVRAVGVALARARETPDPFENGAVRRPGWQVMVRFAQLTQPWTPKDHITELVRLLPERHSPLRSNGDADPAIYLAAVPRKMAAAVRRLAGNEIDRLVDDLIQRAGGQFPDDVAEEALRQRKDLSPAHKRDLLDARRGQGVFRSSLEKIESACRLTGLLDRRHLRAVHIKPWRYSNDAEKLDGQNGLLLSPHLEHLFARGYISFSNSGELLVSRNLNPAVLDKWGLRVPRHGDAFRPEQCRYLDYHRAEVFDRHIGGRRKSQGQSLEDLAKSNPGVPVTVYAEE